MQVDPMTVEIALFDYTARDYLINFTSIRVDQCKCQGKLYA